MEFLLTHPSDDLACTHLEFQGCWLLALLGCELSKNYYEKTETYKKLLNLINFF